MKKIVLTCMSLVLLTGCFSKSGQTKFPTPSTNYTYTSSPLKLEDGDIDKYLMQDNVQYIDLRSHKDKAAGYIDGFEFMPYWEFLWEDSTPGKGRGQNGELSG